MVEAIRFLIDLNWNPERKEEVELNLMKWSIDKDVSWILPPHTILGENRNIGIAEATPNIIKQIYKDCRTFGEIIFSPIMESNKFMRMISRAEEWGEAEDHILFLIERIKSCVKIDDD